MQSLPALALSDDIASALVNGNVLLRAEPGAGKSTALPLALLLEANLGGKIILLEPRRLAARSVAERLAFHLNEKVGQRVGLRMRSDTRVSAVTQLEVVTEGVLTRILQNDPLLEGVALVIFDEFHERSLHADIGLALCLEVQLALRDDLRILLMSATVDAQQLEASLPGLSLFDCAVRQHEVQTFYLGESRDRLEQRVAQAVVKAMQEHAGDILVFLPGVAEIHRCARALSPHADGSSVAIHPLHSGVGKSAALNATMPSKAGCRRLILSTSLAETSITIDGVCVVVDSGLERRARCDSATGAQLLETLPASQASATQRAGRAGRTAPGVCYRLWSREGHNRRTTHWQPEILRADLAPLMLQMGLWGASDIYALPWLEKPPQASVARAQSLLAQLGLWGHGQINARGREVAGLPVHPRLGHMLVWAAARGAGFEACKVAAVLENYQTGSSSADIELLTRQKPSSDVERATSQLAAIFKQPRSSVKKNISRPSLAVLLAQSYPDWIAKRRPGEPGRFQLACGAGAVIDKDDPLAHAQWLVVAQLGGAGSQARIFKAIALDINELDQHSATHSQWVDHLDWDDDHQRVVAEQRLMIGSLLVSTRPMLTVSDSDKATALLAAILRKGVSCLPWNVECRQWQARMLRMRDVLSESELQDWPRADDEMLADSLEQWLLPFLNGVSSMKAVQQLELMKPLSSILDYRQQTLLDDWLPTRYTVPSGSRIRLDYTQPGQPRLSVRLQEMLGCALNPSLAMGRLPLTVELLSPAGRPVQLTQDLVNFWNTSYEQVKKEMAGRYPKHIWPDDPLAASPTTRAKPRKQVRD